MSHSRTAAAQRGGMGSTWVVAFAFLVKMLLILTVLGCQPVQRAEVGAHLKRVKGRVAVSVASVDADTSWDIRGEEPFAAGDSVAVFVLAELFRQIELEKIDLAELLPVGTPSDTRVLPEARRGPLSSLRSSRPAANKPPRPAAGPRPQPHPSPDNPRSTPPGPTPRRKPAPTTSSTPIQASINY